MIAEYVHSGGGCRAHWEQRRDDIGNSVARPRRRIRIQMIPLQRTTIKLTKTRSRNEETRSEVKIEGHLKTETHRSAVRTAASTPQFSLFLLGNFFLSLSLSLSRFLANTSECWDILHFRDPSTMKLEGT